MPCWTNTTLLLSALGGGLCCVLMLRRMFFRRPLICRCASPTGLHAVITGATSGIGRATAFELARRQWKLTLGCRNLDAAHQLQKELEAATNNGNLRVEHLDLTIPETISEFARSIADSPIHVLINNAGVMCAEPEYVVMGTSEGAVEQNVATNYLGHFYLTHCLLNCLRRTAEEENLVIIPRIIIVSSSLCSKGTVDGLFSADWDTRNWNTTQAYANSKLACSLMARELHRRFGPRSLNVYCVYTGGMVDTNLSRHVLQGYASPTRYLLRLLSRVLLKPPLDGCQSIVHCAVSDNVLTAHCSDAEAAVDDDLTGSGRLYSNCVPIAWPSAAQDPQVARRLWEETVKFLDLDDSS